MFVRSHITCTSTSTATYFFRHLRKKLKLLGTVLQVVVLVPVLVDLICALSEGYLYCLWHFFNTFIDHMYVVLVDSYRIRTLVDTSTGKATQKFEHIITCTVKHVLVRVLCNFTVYCMKTRLRSVLVASLARELQILVQVPGRTGNI